MAEAEAEAKSIKTRILIYNIGSVIKTKARHRINVLQKLKQHNRKSLQTRYISFIRPLLEYADVVWDNCTHSASQMNK